MKKLKLTNREKIRSLNSGFKLLANEGKSYLGENLIDIKYIQEELCSISADMEIIDRNSKSFSNMMKDMNTLFARIHKAYNVPVS